MSSPPSSPSVLASTSRHNIIHPFPTQRDSKSIRLFLGHESDTDDDVYESAQHASLSPESSSKAVSHDGFSAACSSPRKHRTATAVESPSKKVAVLFAKPTTAGVYQSPSKRHKNFLVRGNVTPSRAYGIFKAAKRRQHREDQFGLLTPPSTSPSSIFYLNRSEEDSPSKKRSPRSSRALMTSSPSSLCFDVSPSHSSFATLSSKKPIDLRSAFSSITDTKSGISRLGGTRALRPVAKTTTFLETFISPSVSHVQVASSLFEDAYAHPISSAYSYSSRSVHPSAQWLAVGDDEGRITLVDTLPAQNASAEAFASHPQWDATPQAAVFELTWRFDDRVLLSGSSDYSVRSWDTEHQICTGVFQGHAGSPRTIVYDPTTNGDGGCGNIFASAGRDGSVCIWDARSNSCAGKHSTDKLAGQRPVATIDVAHTGMMTAKTKRGAKRQVASRSGVTALTYLPDGNGHKLLSGGSSNAIVKCWDLRNLTHGAVHEVDLDTAPPRETWATPDLSLVSAGSHRRSHGLSQIIASSTHLYASCTGGRVYTLPLASFLDQHFDAASMLTLYDSVQCQNTLFSRMSLYNDQFLAVGCNSGDVALWDVQRQHAASAHQPGRPQTIRDIEEECRSSADFGMGIGYQSENSDAVILHGGHAKNTEINSVAWANGPNGPTLSSIGDDASIRSWYPDRALRNHITQISQH